MSIKRIQITMMTIAAAGILLAGCGNEESDTEPAADTQEPAVEEQKAYAMEDVAYMQTSDKPFGEIVAAIETAAAENKFKVLAKHDIQKSLNEKGFEMTPYVIIEVCNGKFAHTILSDTKEAGMFLPCRIAVYKAGGTNNVIMMKPTLIGSMMPDADFGTIPEDVEEILKNVIDTAVE